MTQHLAEVRETIMGEGDALSVEERAEWLDDHVPARIRGEARSDAIMWGNLVLPAWARAQKETDPFGRAVIRFAIDVQLAQDPSLGGAVRRHENLAEHLGIEPIDLYDRLLEDDRAPVD
jgi:hypothetical protein